MLFRSREAPPGAPLPSPSRTPPPTPRGGRRSPSTARGDPAEAGAENAVLGCNLKNNRMISVRFQGKPLNITVIQAYAPSSNAEEAEVEWFYEDLQDLLELIPKARVAKKNIFRILRHSLLRNQIFSLISKGFYLPPSREIIRSMTLSAVFFGNF